MKAKQLSPEKSDAHYKALYRESSRIANLYQRQLLKQGKAMREAAAWLDDPGHTPETLAQAAQNALALLRQALH